MRILDRYILRAVLNLFFSCLFIFLFLYCIIDTFTHLDDLLKQRVPIMLLLQYYAAYLPFIFVEVAPFAGLLAMLYTFGRLNRDNEIIAMRASGLSVFQITRTVLVFGTILSLLIFWCNDSVVPRASVFALKVKEQMDTSGKEPKPKPHEMVDHLSMYGQGNRLFFVNNFSFDNATMEGITILEHDAHQNITKKIVANKGVYIDHVWHFYQSDTFVFDENGQIKGEPQYMEEELMNIPETPRDFLEQRQRPDQMSYRQLEGYLRKLSKSGAVGVIRKLQVDLYRKVAKPLTALISIILAIPFSLMMRKRATGLSSIGISILVGFLYYVLDPVSAAFGYAGYLSPFFAASSAHILVLLSSLYLIQRIP